MLILGAPYRYLLPNLYLSVADIANPDLLVCGSRNWISLDIARFYKEHCHPSSRSACPTSPKNCNRAPWRGRGRNHLHRVCQTAVTAPPRVGCVVWNHFLFFCDICSIYDIINQSFSCLGIFYYWSFHVLCNYSTLICGFILFILNVISSIFSYSLPFSHLPIG